MSSIFYNGWTSSPNDLISPPTAPASIVGYADGNGGSWVWPTGTVANDIGLIYGIGNNQMALSGWNAINGTAFESPSGDSFLWKVLTSSDLATVPPVTTPSYGHITLVVIRGSNTIRKASTSPTSYGSSSTIPGFTKSSNSKFILVTQSDRDAFPPSSWNYPSGYTGIFATYSTYFSTRISYVESSTYTNGTGITVPLIPSSWGGIGTALEAYTV